MDRRRRMARAGSNRYKPHDDDALPDSINWRWMGRSPRSRIREAAGVAGRSLQSRAVEGISKIVTGDLFSLSEQELVDCDTSYNQGCNGGFMDYAFEFIIKNGGIDTEEDYPYVGVDGKCDTYRENTKVVTIDGYEDVPANDEKSLKKAVANQPVSVEIEDGGREFQRYDPGVFTCNCKTALDHGVEAVGYCNENELDYWIVGTRGATAGERAVIRMVRNMDGTANLKCGIAMEASYPESNTCCCVYQYANYCFAWGCCPLEAASYCDDNSSCCPHEYPICNVNEGTCLMSKNSPMLVKALKWTPAKFHWPFANTDQTSA